MSRRVRATAEKKIKGPRSKVTSLKADPRAWAHAVQLAAGDKSRLVICSDGAVIVRNP